jgi:hypothetical protein
MSYKPTAEIVQMIERERPPPRDGEAYSYPIPVRREGALEIAIFHYSAGYDAQKQGMLLGAADQITFYDPATGAQRHEEPMPPAPALGTEAFGVERGEYGRLSAELYAAYDTLLPAFTRAEARPSAEVKAAAIAYGAIFPKFAGKLFRPTYEKIGKDWFVWLLAVEKASLP